MMNVKQPAVAKALLSTNEVAAEYGIPKATLGNWRCQGLGPKFVQFATGGAVHYRRAAIEQWLDDNTRNNTSATQ